MKQKIEAVIFDADGTILNSIELLYRSFEHVLALHGHPVPDRKEIAKYAGPPLIECYRLLVPGGNHEMLCETHMSFQKNTSVEGYEGALEVLKKLKQANIKMGICTNRTGNVVDLL